jgi:serine/threonine-protein kinase
MSAPAPPSSVDEELAAILSDLMERARQGTAVDIETVVVQHPAFAAELRELWATVQIADDLGSGTADTLIPDGRPFEPVLGGLPRQFGDYELLEEIGRGGMGVVYKARQISLDRLVALKLILRGEFASPADLERFRVEASSAARLEHPHIVPVYQVGEFEGQPFFTMKYITGTTLARQLADGPLGPTETARLLEPVCQAVAFAHQRGVLHRDLKPSNILIDEAGQPHVSDFGLAKRLTKPDDGSASARLLTQTGDIIGTPSYISPEQAAGNRGEVGPASDVYSLGAVLYQCLTGRPPFQAASSIDTLLMVLEQDPPLPRTINPKVDADLEMIALKCLQKPSDLRYATAGALGEDLRAYLSNEPISARSTNLGQLVSRLLRETHHAPVLENWGVLWMWHSVVLVVLCVTTNVFQHLGVTTVKPYMALWVLGLGLWAFAFWAMRRRSGPITFVERQIAHVWAGSVISSTMLFFIEMLLKLPVLSLSPVLGLISGSVFLVKAGILSGAFYIQAVALFATALVMCFVPQYGVTIFGIVSAVCFFVPGWKYHRQRINNR